MLALNNIFSNPNTFFISQQPKFIPEFIRFVFIFYVRCPAFDINKIEMLIEMLCDTLVSQRLIKYQKYLKELGLNRSCVHTSMSNECLLPY